ncbi:MAG: hypothetical protein BWK80_08480 [Desulfobacteraceae bacterium IS3]|nr:MAG: hypothetical protein BWK80_08480 [Desulfobacteraceae bacterium IS3]
MTEKPSYEKLLQKINELEQNAAEHSREKERVAHVNAVLNAIREINRLITKEKDRNRLIKGACESLITNRGYYNAWIILADDFGTLLGSAEAGLGKKIFAITEKIKKGDPTYCCKKSLEMSDVLSIENPFSTCLQCPISGSYKGRGAMSARLEHKGKIYGILTVSVPAVLSRQPEEHGLFKNIADYIAFALHNIEAQEERRRAEETLRKAHDELERRVKERTKELELLSSRILNAHEEERKRIAGDLHDGIGQSLSAIKFMVETTLESMKKENTVADISSLESLVPMLQKASEEVRTIVMNLRPSMLDDLGILATVRWFFRQFRSVYACIRLEERINIPENAVPDVLKTIIFRVLQEAMNNIAKHSGADFVRVYLEKTQRSIDLVILDNGRGFDLASLSATAASGETSGGLPEKGFGITGMKERTELSGGKFCIESAPGAGTVVRASWNCKAVHREP